MYKVILNEGWRLGKFEKDGEKKGAYKPEYDDSSWLRVNVPSEVHLELLRNGLIEDPFYYMNLDKYLWIPAHEWWYRLRFKLPSSIAFSKAFLVFHGLDTLATVWLNGKKVGSFKNMFRRYELDITDEILREGENVLAVRLASILECSSKSIEFKDWSEWRAKEWLGFRPKFRKAQMSFGWDIAPKLLTVGIWKDVELILVRNAMIEDVHIITKVIEEGKEAEVNAVIQIASYMPGKELHVISSILDGDNLIAKSKKVIKTERGLQEVVFKFKISNPKLWWPWDVGEPYLYLFKVNLYCDNELEDSRSIKFGIREVKLLTRGSSGGNTFRFLINGKPIYVRGINWTPPDAIFVRISKERYEELLRKVKDMNANMLRVWGGGIYPHEVFYDLCDKMGIMIWQDFMFACAYYPKDEEFLSEAREEATDVVKRLRNHPSIVLWCGDNECDAMFHPEGHPLNRKVLKEVCEKLDPTRPYWPSSPCGGEKPNSPYEGDTHIWHHGEYYRSSVYEKELGMALFISEIGHLSCPDRKTLESYIPKEKLWPPNESYRFGYHPWSLRRLKRLERAMKAYWDEIPDVLDEYIRVAQLLQAEAYKYWVEKCRRRKFSNSGIVLWNVTDCWPQCSDSIIDYYGRPKLAYYYVKVAFSPILISAEKRREEIVLWVINDTLNSFNGLLRIIHYEYPAKIMSVHEERVKIPANSSRIIKRLPIAELMINDEGKEYLLIELLGKNKTILARNILFFTETKNLKFPPEKLIINITR